VVNCCGRISVVRFRGKYLLYVVVANILCKKHLGNFVVTSGDVHMWYDGVRNICGR
jgi:hypothetical protein